MARIHLLEPSEMTPQQREVFDSFPVNLTKALLRTSKSAGAYLTLGASFRDNSLEPAIREAAILRVSALKKSAYETMHHSPAAAKAGLSQETISAIQAGDAGSLPQNYQVLLKYVDECVSRTKVSNEVFSEAASVFSEENIADLTLLIGHYLMTATFLETLDIDLDTEPIPS